MGRTISVRWRAWREAAAARLPAPMAAPETPRQRQLRTTLITLLAILAVLTSAWPAIAATCLRAPAALVWLTLALTSLIIGVRWLTIKVRADNAWLISKGEE